MPSLNVYIPEELKERMSAHDLNWSQIASAAIRTAIEIQELSTVNVQEATITRLRAQRSQTTSKRRAEGVSLGVEWASDETTDFDQLEAVAELRQQEFEAAGHAFQALLNAIYGESADGRDVHELTEYLSGGTNKNPTLEFLEGFCEGAGSVYDQV